MKNVLKKAKAAVNYVKCKPFGIPNRRCIGVKLIADGVYVTDVYVHKGALNAGKGQIIGYESDGRYR